MSSLVVGRARWSCQVMIAPPAPSGTALGTVWSLAALHTEIWLPALHARVPPLVIRCAEMSHVPPPLRSSCQATMAPPAVSDLSLIHISEPTRQAEISYAVF